MSVGCNASNRDPRMKTCPRRMSVPKRVSSWMQSYRASYAHRRHPQEPPRSPCREGQSSRHAGSSDRLLRRGHRESSAFHAWVQGRALPASPGRQERDSPAARRPLLVMRRRWSDSVFGHKIRGTICKASDEEKGWMDKHSPSRRANGFLLATDIFDGALFVDNPCSLCGLLSRRRALKKQRLSWVCDGGPDSRWMGPRRFPGTAILGVLSKPLADRCTVYARPIKGTSRAPRT